jgi:hypothetical protein
VKAATWAQWQAWVQATAVVESVRAWDDGYSDRGEVVRDLRPLGGPLIVRWQGPAGPPMRAFSSKGDRQMREGPTGCAR